MGIEKNPLSVDGKGRRYIARPAAKPTAEPVTVRRVVRARMVAISITYAGGKVTRDVQVDGDPEALRFANGLADALEASFTRQLPPGGGA